jgi:hypothetical protein
LREEGLHPGFHPGTFSAVPPGLNVEPPVLTQTI